MSDSEVGSLSRADVTDALRAMRDGELPVAVSRRRNELIFQPVEPADVPNKDRSYFVTFSRGLLYTVTVTKPSPAGNVQVTITSGMHGLFVFECMNGNTILHSIGVVLSSQYNYPLIFVENKADVECVLHSVGGVIQSGVLTHLKPNPYGELPTVLV